MQSDEFSLDRQGQQLVTATMLAGAFAGLSVDLSLYPLDTVKTRLQSGLGFASTGGFRALYAGAPSVMIGSAPGSALFFLSYECFKRMFGPYAPTDGAKDFTVSRHLSHLLAATAGETVACVVRVPTEIVKQRAQAFPTTSPASIFKNILAEESLVGLYRGFGATILREIPFSAIELPLWEYLKHRWAVKNGRPTSAWQSALCGSFAGAIAAALTTPLDVIKTRVMLSQKLYQNKPSFQAIFEDIWKTRGFRGLFAGLVPRTIWMAAGGLIFFGAYDAAVKFYIFANPRIHSFEDDGHGLSKDIQRRPMFLFDFVMVDFLYNAIFKYFRDSTPRLETFDDVIKAAEEVKAQRREAIAAHKLKQSKEGSESDAKKDHSSAGK